MLHVYAVRGRDRSAYSIELESYLRWCHRIFVEERGRVALGGSTAAFLDADAAPDATDLIAMLDGTVVAGSRMSIITSETSLGIGFNDATSSGAGMSVGWSRLFVIPEHRQ